MDEWLVVLPDRMPAYISVERYEANLARMAANRNIAQSPGRSRGRRCWQGCCAAGVVAGIA